VSNNLSDIVTAYLDALRDGAEDAELDLTAAIDTAGDALTAKVSACVAVVESLEGRAKVERERVQRTQAHARALENSAERLRSWVAENLARAGLERLDCGTVEVRTAKKPPSVRLDEPTFLAWAAAERDELLRFKDPEPDKKAILAALKQGEVIPGAALITDARRLTW